jgi:hypothetical protein
MVLQMPRPFKKPETGVYYYPRIVPDDLKATIGKSEVARQIEKEWADARRGVPAFPQLHSQDLLEDALAMEGITDERDATEEWEPSPKALRAAIRSRTGASVALEVAEAVYLRAASPATATAPDVTLTGILDGWWREAKSTGRKPSTHESYGNTVVGLVAFLRHDNAKLVTPEDIVRFKDHRLSSVNPRTGKPISAKTVKDSDLAGLKTLFGWAVSNRRSIPTIRSKKPGTFRH